jgi:hypothetical protein
VEEGKGRDGRGDQTHEARARKYPFAAISPEQQPRNVLVKRRDFLPPSHAPGVRLERGGERGGEWRGAREWGHEGGVRRRGERDERGERGEMERQWSSRGSRAVEEGERSERQEIPETYEFRVGAGGGGGPYTGRPRMCGHMTWCGVLS